MCVRARARPKPNEEERVSSCLQLCVKAFLSVRRGRSASLLPVVRGSLSREGGVNLGEGQQKPEIHEEKEIPPAILRAIKPSEVTPPGLGRERPDSCPCL